MKHKLPALLEWDTRFFGFPVARLEAKQLSPADLEACLAWARDHKVRCLYVLREQEDHASARTLEQHGSTALDERSTYSIRLEPSSSGPSQGIRHAVPEDLARLMDTAASAYTDSRFFMDPRFVRERCAALYRTWIERSMNGAADLVLVEGPVGSPRGSVTVKFHPDHAQIGLISVVPEARGQGLAQALMRAAMDAALRNGHGRMEVVTQGRNAAARRLYESLGFQLGRVQCWHHIWLD